jgi:hypothetical protein
MDRHAKGRIDQGRKRERQMDRQKIDRQTNIQMGIQAVGWMDELTER